MFCSLSLTYLALLAERYTVDKPYPIEHAEGERNQDG